MTFRLTARLGDVDSRVQREAEMELGHWWLWRWTPWVYRNDDSKPPRYLSVSWLCFKYQVFDWRGWTWDETAKAYVRESNAAALLSTGGQKR